MEVENLSVIKKIVHRICNPDQTENGQIVEQLGEWLLKFKKSDLGRVKIIVPTYNTDLVQLAIDYLKLVHFTSDLFEKRRFQLESFHYLLNVFQKRGNSFYFSEESIDSSIIKWSNSDCDIYTLDNEFLPVFCTLSTSLSADDKRDLLKLFKVFKEIRNEKILEYPIEIKTDEKSILVVNRSNLLPLSSNSNFKDFEFDTSNDSETLNDDIKQIESLQSNLQIVLRYPYHSYIDTHYIRNDIKVFEIEFKNRFFISDINKITENEIYFPKNYDFEINKFQLLNPSDFLIVYETNHNSELYNLLSELYSEWKDQYFNKYIHPFPKYFLLFICQGQPLEYWIENFRKSYPLVAEKGIFIKFEKIIKLLWDLNWTYSYFSNVREEVNILFSDLQKNNISSKILKNPFLVFKNYIMTISHNCTFNENIEEGHKNVVLNSFDSFDILNKIFSANVGNVSVIIPDFLFYNFNSFFAYNLINIQCKSFYTQANIVLFPNILEYKKKVENMQKEVLNNSRTALKNYRKRFTEEDKLEEIENEMELHENSEEILNEEEEIREVLVKEVSNYQITCEMIDSRFKEFNSNEFVYVKRNNVIKIRASQLKKSDFILDLKVAKENFITLFERRLDSIPDSVKNFKKRLHEVDNVFETLKKHNLKIASKSYFNSTYVSGDENFNMDSFRLPRKQDRNVICRFLGIDYNDMNLAYLIKYKKKNEITTLYREIMIFLMDSEALGRLKSKEVVDEVENILRRNSISDSDEYDIDEFAEQVIENISRNLENYLIEVRQVKINSYE